MTDEQLRFLAQMHRGYESSEQHTMSETFERMDKREAMRKGMKCDEIAGRRAGALEI